jgi:hypothetical protein
MDETMYSMPCILLLTVLGMEDSSFGFGGCSLGKVASRATSGVLTKAANLAFAPRADSWELRRILCATHG